MLRLFFMALAESVSARLRKHGFKCNTVAISIRDNGLYHFSRQMHLREPTDITDEIMKAAMELFRNNYDWSHPIRSLGVRGADLVTADIPVQMSLFMNEAKRARQEKMDKAVDEIRRRFGYFSIQRAFYVSRQDIIKAGCAGIPHSSSGRVLLHVSFEPCERAKKQLRYACI